MVLPGIERRTGVKFEYVPVLLGGIFKATGNVSRSTCFVVSRTSRISGAGNPTLHSSPQHTNFRPNPFFPVNTLMLMRGAVAAQFEGVFEPYFRAAYHHMWEEPKKMDDLEIFRKAFIASGIDIDRLIARAQQDDVKKGLIDRTTDAVNRGAFGSPTFFVGKEMFFGKDQLRDVEEFDRRADQPAGFENGLRSGIERCRVRPICWACTTSKLQSALQQK